MSNSTSLIDQISSTQANKEVVANANFDAASPSMLWGRHASGVSGLTWAFYGGWYNGAQVANGTVTLTASATNYVYASTATGAVSANTTGFPATGAIPLYTVVTGATTITSYTDQRTSGAGGSALSLLTDTNISGPTNGQTLVYQTSDNKWHNVTPGPMGVLAFSPSAGSTTYAPAGGYVVGAELLFCNQALLTRGTDYTATDGVNLNFTNATKSGDQFVLVTLSAMVGGSPFDAISFYPGSPGASAVLLQAIVPQKVTFPAGLAGSYGYGGTAPTGSVTCNINRITGGTSSATVGTMSVAAGATSATFSFGSAVTFNAGDMIQVVAPSTADATWANVSVALVGSR
ncbi:Uncharacterised protein [Burkholderia pseudomallei]|uniref:hypothetical protein n=1 Tax=Burkholderia pseudomallei TaxID=28450 RepID=UPI000F085044|nr:hypothetical protein [Burkholderia pseudomallei]CAJ2907292.1 Uncharacterised protein [Burkholderia pseudomallei]VCG48081.1 Uncharacterised protein [Burkholderia pseudomallei]VCG67288.1 Uncharacterised protein [Burkholderia pseudomallei]VCG69590.1 Uncharacterised protein [Burkholderia pseudomallei]VCG73649.1 Uncharacterised protein [Burkholderia pseudomallei]